MPDDFQLPSDPPVRSTECSTALERVVANLADPYKWNWCYVLSYRAAADRMLRLLASEGIIEYRQHPMGGEIWRTNGKLYGRTDGITHQKFDELVR